MLLRRLLLQPARPTNLNKIVSRSSQLNDTAIAAIEQPLTWTRNLCTICLIPFKIGLSAILRSNGRGKFSNRKTYLTD